jgi:hypothetical protein
MARIRSIKPETFTSEDFTALSLESRLTFIGLWTYVDDAGRGKADPRLIKAALWPLDDAVPAFVVAKCLDDMELHGMICRYRAEDRDYLHVVHFHDHQRPQHPTGSKLPACDRAVHGVGDSASTFAQVKAPTREAHEDSRNIPEPSREIPEPSRETLPGAGNREQGTGSREQGALARTAPPDTAQALLGEWIDHCPQRPPKQVLGQVAKMLGSLLGEGYAPEQVRRGLAAWHEKGLHPAALPAVVHEVINTPMRRGKPNLDEKVTAQLRRADQLEREGL